jgi:hypothetical protein
LHEGIYGKPHQSWLNAQNGKIRVLTVNGFAQGDGRTTVPFNPGTNTWTANPGGTSAFKLTETTGTRPRNLVRGTPNVGIVNYLCCKAP